jgi:hypothetical protein
MCFHAKHVFSNQFGWYLSFICVITEKCVYFDNDPLTVCTELSSLLCIQSSWWYIKGMINGHQGKMLSMLYMYITWYTKTCFFLGVACTCHFSRMTYFWSIALFRCNDFIRSLYYFWTIPKTLIAQHYFCLIYI